MTHQRKTEQCNGNNWALGPYCMVLEKFQRFTEPVPMQKRGGARPWYEASAEELEQFRQRLPDTPPICHDLSVLEAPLGEARSAGSPDDDESSLSQLREQPVDYLPTE